MIIEILSTWLWLNSHWPVFAILASGLCVVAMAVDVMRKES